MLGGEDIRRVASGRETVRFALRRATAEHHLRTEAAFDHHDIGSLAGYARFLDAHRAALHAIEPQLDGGGWREWRPRLPELERDRAALPVPVPHRIDSAPFALPPGNAAIWGAQYVLEGSRLGGQVLATRIPDGAPHDYIAGPSSGAAWRRFCTALDMAAPAGDPLRKSWLLEALEGAKAAFMTFQHAARTPQEIAA